MAMEFWGAEIKAGEPLKVEKEDGTLLHLSQASLGEVKKGSGNESVVLYVTIDGKKIVLGTLSSDKFPQIAYDLVFEKDFELSHNWKHGSVYVCGYRADADDESEDGMFGSESEEEEDDIPTPLAENGKTETKAEKKAPAEKAKATKPDPAAAKQKVKAAKPVSEDSEEDDSDDSEDDDSDEEMLGSEDGSSEEEDEEESSEEEDEATPKNAKQNKKRPSESATKTPVPEKKAKLVTPQKSGGEGKKGTAHTATPHPSKAGKGDKGKQQTPKSGGSVKCQACSKTFNSDGALQSHTKAKHSEVK